MIKLIVPVTYAKVSQIRATLAQSGFYATQDAGKVTARGITLQYNYDRVQGTLAVEVLSKPAFLSESTLQKMLERHLGITK